MFSDHEDRAMIHVALIQMCASGTKEENLDLIRRMVGEAVEGAKKLDSVLSD